MATKKTAAEARDEELLASPSEEGEDESDDDEEETDSSSPSSDGDDEDEADEPKKGSKKSDDDSDDEEEDEEDDEDDDEEEDDEPKKGSKKSDDDDDDGDEDDEEEEAPKAAKPSAEPLPLGTMYSVRNVLTITKREIRAYFDSLVAYVVVGVSMLLLGLYFFFYGGGFWQVDRATLAPLFDIMPFALCVMTPLVTMGSLAEEKRSGTIELLITMPVKDSEVILGKFFAALTMCTVLLLASLVYPIAMFVWPWHLGPLDWGPIWTGYLGLILMSSAGVALGLLYSSITESQIIAFFVSVFTMVILYSIGFVVEIWHNAAGDIIGFVSFKTRFLPFSRGIVDTRAVIYFLSIAIISLVAAFRSLESRKWS